LRREEDDDEKESAPLAHRQMETCESEERV
jgi:hypothetical protein